LFSTLFVNIPHHQNRLNFVTETEEKIVHSTIENAFFLKATRFSPVAVFTLQRLSANFQSSVTLVLFSETEAGKLLKIRVISTTEYLPQKIVRLIGFRLLHRNCQKDFTTLPKTLHKI